MDKEKRQKYVVFGLIGALIMFLWFWLTRTPGGQTAQQAVQEYFPGFSIPGIPGLTPPDISVVTPGTGTPIESAPININSCNCKASFCDDNQQQQVKKAPDWASQLLGQGFGVSGSTVKLDVNGTPSQVYGFTF